jgi:hypothetical protein
MTPYKRLFTEETLEERFDPMKTVDSIIEKIKTLTDKIKIGSYNKMKNYLSLFTSKGETKVYIEKDGLYLPPSVFPPYGEKFGTVDELVRALV